MPVSDEPGGRPRYSMLAVLRTTVGNCFTTVYSMYMTPSLYIQGKKDWHARRSTTTELPWWSAWRACRAQMAASGERLRRVPLK